MKQNTPSSIMTIGGQYFDFLKPHEAEFTIIEIAHALSNICRYTGHTRTFYSVAQHSVIVSKIVPPEHALAGLLHDAPEAFIGDVAKPLKNLLPDYQVIEASVEAAVMDRYGVPLPLPDCVKEADLIALRTEQRDLMGADNHEWLDSMGIEPLPDPIVPLAPIHAYTLFLDQYTRLVGAKYGIPYVDSVRRATG